MEGHALTIDIGPYFSGPLVAQAQCACGRWVRTWKGGDTLVAAVTRAHRDHVNAQKGENGQQR